MFLDGLNNEFAQLYSRKFVSAPLKRASSKFQFAMEMSSRSIVMMSRSGLGWIGRKLSIFIRALNTAFTVSASRRVFHFSAACRENSRRRERTFRAKKSRPVQWRLAESKPEFIQSNRPAAGM